MMFSDEHGFSESVLDCFVNLQNYRRFSAKYMDSYDEVELGVGPCHAVPARA